MPDKRPTALLSRIGAAIPDALSAGLFLFGWIAPLALDGLVRNLMLIMLVEFLLIHAPVGLAGVMIVAGRRVKWGAWAALASMIGLYLLFVGAYSLAFGQWWPLLAFGWLLVGKATAQRARDAPDSAGAIWAASVVFYLVAAFLGVFLPMPRFGITPDIVPLLDMVGEGVWSERPQSVLASGVIYYSLLALLKFKLPVWSAPDEDHRLSMSTDTSRSATP